MGIKNFYKFVKQMSPRSIESKHISYYSNKTLGIDANLLLYRFLIKNINDNFNKNIFEDNYESFYKQLLDVITYSYKYNIKLIFIFDGKSPDIKKETILERQSRRHKAQDKLKKINQELELELKQDPEIQRKLSLNAVHLNGKIIQSVKDILKASGIQYINAPCEADSQCARLFKNNIIDGIVSSDFDILTFGGGKLIMNMFNNINNNTILEINLDKLLKNLKINNETFTDLCILMGSDYSDKPKYQYEFLFDKLKYYKTFEKFNESINTSMGYNLKLPKNLDINKIRNYFNECIGNDYEKNSFEFGNIDISQLNVILEKVITKNTNKIFNYINSIINFSNYWKIKNIMK